MCWWPCRSVDYTYVKASDFVSVFVFVFVCVMSVSLSLSLSLSFDGVSILQMMCWWPCRRVDYKYVKASVNDVARGAGSSIIRELQTFCPNFGQNWFCPGETSGGQLVLGRAQNWQCLHLTESHLKHSSCNILNIRLGEGSGFPDCSLFSRISPPSWFDV